MKSKYHNGKIHSSPHSSSRFCTIRSSTILTISLFIASLVYFFAPVRYYNQSFLLSQETSFNGDLRDANFPWNKLCFGPPFQKLKLAVFSKTWPIGASPGGMERHASTLYTALAAKGHEVHVFTVPSDRKHHEDIHEGNLHVYFAANDHGGLDSSKAFVMYNDANQGGGAFDYVHTESVSLPHWRAKMVPKVAVTWHGIWYEIMHSKLFQQVITNENDQIQAPFNDLQEAMPRLLDEIKFFPSYTEHICISKSAAEVLINIYQIPPKNVHIILNGVDETKFVHDREGGRAFRTRHGVPNNASLVLGVAGRLVRDKGHPLLHGAFESITKRHPGVFLLVAGSGPWGKRYAKLGPSVKILGDMDPSELSQFYNALDLFVNPTLRPQGLDLTLIEAMHCGTPVLTTNFPSITGSVVLNEDYGYTFPPNIRSLLQSMEAAIRDGPIVLQKKGMICRKHALSMFTATKMALVYERFFLCMTNPRYCQYPLPTDC